MPPATRQRSRTGLALGALGVAIACVVTMLGNPAAAAGKDRTLTLHVSPDGKGSGSCQPRVPCSLEQAQEVVRHRGGRERDIVVRLAGGTYRLTEPLRFDARDSGSTGHPITWTAAPGETPVISGASPVTGWTQLGAPVTAAGTASTQDAGMIFTSHSTSVGQAEFSQFTVETSEGDPAG